MIYSRADIATAYRTGRGSIQMRAKCTIEKMEKGTREAIIVHEIPYQVNKAKLIEEIADLVRNKKLEGISDLRDESDREGMRIVIELKRGENPEVVLNNLYKHTRLAGYLRCHFPGHCGWTSSGSEHPRNSGTFCYAPPRSCASQNRIRSAQSRSARTYPGRSHHCAGSSGCK